MNKSKTKVCYVVCYKDPDYIRTRTLTSALKQIKGIELIEVHNRWRGAARYLEVPIKLIGARIKYRPDTFIVGFRAQEIFWALYPAMLGKKKIFDEFINIHDYLTNEHKKSSDNSLFIRALDAYMRWVLGRCDKILSDTPAHAKLSSQIYAVELKKFLSVPVGADEGIFTPRSPLKKTGPFNVLFYGSMLPLHGIEVALEAMRILEEAGRLDNVVLTLVGGGEKKQHELKTIAEAGGIAKKIDFINWVDFKKLPDLIAASDIVLGGPFGVTGQAGRVITGKTYQSLAMAKPVVIGRSAATSLFEDKKNCLMVERGSAKSLADCLDWAMSHSAQLDKIGEAGRRLYEKNFSVGSISRLLEGCL